MEKTFKKMLKDEIVRLRGILGDNLVSVIVSREDFRLLTWEISKQANGFEDTVIRIDDTNILSSKDMPINEGERFNSVQTPKPIHLTR